MVVLYNPFSICELIENIKTYIDELDCLILIDNSETDVEIGEVLELSDKIQYHSMHGNKGLARGLNCGCKILLKRMSDYILLLDQDSFFMDGALALLKSKINKDDKIGLYAPNINAITREGANRIPDDKLQFPFSDMEISFAITSGSVIDAEVYEQTGGFDNRLFIAQIDQDYCCRLEQMGMRKMRKGDAVLFQEFGNPVVRKVMGKKLKIFENTPQRYYYVARNEIYLRNKWGIAYQKYRINFLKYFVAVMLQHQGGYKVCMMVKGILDGLKMRTT